MRTYIHVCVYVCMYRKLKFCVCFCLRLCLQHRMVSVYVCCFTRTHTYTPVSAALYGVGVCLLYCTRAHTHIRIICRR